MPLSPISPCARYKNCFWTKSGARLKCIKRVEGSSLNWIFLPGGPGLGSESLAELTAILHFLPGNLWHLDLPGDGSNTTPNNKESFQHWSFALIEAVEYFEHVILVGHSTGGMYALSTPRLETLLDGLVLLDSAPDSGWQALFGEEVAKRPLPEAERIQESYLNHPNNQTLKELTVASAPYLFTDKGMEAGIEMLKGLSYNFESCQWSDEHFDKTYQAKWIPKDIPTLILSGELDIITPLHLFSRAKDFCGKNITIKSIKNAGHFPWIDNPLAVAAAFQEYYKNF